MLSLLKALDPARLTGSGGDRKQGGRKEGEKAREKWKERGKGLGKRKEEESWRGGGTMKVSGPPWRTVPAARPSRPPPASSCSLHSVWALSHCPSTGSPRAGRGEPGWHLQTAFFFPFPLSLRLCADSHVGELIKPHVLLHRSWGPRMMTSRERHSPTYGRYGSEALGLAISRGFPRDLRRFLHE